MLTIIYHSISFDRNFLSRDYAFESDSESPLIIDCGANMGMSVLFFKHLYPNSSILAFEPNPYAFKMLERNVSVNEFSNVQLFNFGLGEKAEKLEFFLNDNKGSLQGSIFQKRGGNQKMVIDVKPLSSVLKSDRIELIKMDIEGAEHMVIRDLVKNDMVQKAKKYIIEYHHNMEGDRSHLSKFIRTFEDAGFRINLAANFNKIGDFQDILIYCDTSSSHQDDQINSNR